MQGLGPDRRSRLIAALATVLLLCGSAAARHDRAPAKAAVSACVASGFGQVHHSVETSSLEAQRLFEQGLALDYGFNHHQAEECFRRAAKLDPNMAMAWWGVALVLGPNYNMPADAEGERQAYDAIQKALQLSAGGPAVERAYIEALAKRYDPRPGADYQQLEQDYHDAMRQLVARYPDDLDAATLFAESGMNLRPWRLWDNAGNPAPGTEEIVSTLESVLRRDPNHLGANHFYIHALEASPHPEAALPSAARMADLAPASGHLVHMPAHIYTRSGDHDLSALANVKAAAVDEAYIKANKPQGVYPLMYYTHNLHFIAYESSMMGSSSDAVAAASKIYQYVNPHLLDMPMLDAFAALRPQVLVRFRRWDDILGTRIPNGAGSVSKLMWRYARGLAFAAKGRTAAAQNELKALRDAQAEMAKTPSPIGPANSERVADMAAHLIEARIAQAQHDPDAAIARLREAVALQDRMDYDEPPDWFYPIRETLGGALLQAGKPAEAEQVFREDLKRNPRNARSLFGLAEALKAQGRADDARWVQREFAAAWKNADIKLQIEDL